MPRFALTLALVLGPVLAAAQDGEFPVNAHPCTAGAVHPKGDWVAIGTRKGAILVLDARTAKTAFELEGHLGEVYGLAFSPDGKRLASASDQGALIWDLAKRVLVRTKKGKKKPLGHSDRVNKIALSADGKHVVTVGADRTMRCWDTKKLRPRWVRNVVGRGLAVSKTLAITAGEKGVAATLYRLKGGKPAGATPGLSGAFDFGPREKWVVKAGSGGLEIHHLKANKRLFWRAPSSGLYLDAAADPSGRYAAAISNMPGGVVVVDVATGKEVKQLKLRPGNMTCLTFSPNGRELWTGGAGHVIQVFDTDSWQELHHHRSPVRVEDLTFGPKGDWLAIASYDAVAIVDPASMEEQTKLLGGSSVSVAGTLLATASGKGLRLYDTESWQELRSVGGDTDWRLRHLSYTPDGKQLVLGHKEGRITVLDAKKQRRVRHWNPDKGQTRALAVHPEGALVVTSHSARKALMVFDLASGDEQRTLDCEDYEEPGYLTFSPDGAFLAAGKSNLIVWDFVSGKVVHRTTGQLYRLRPAWLAGGKELALSQNAITILSTETWKPTGKRVPPFTKSRGAYHMFCYPLPDGRLLTSNGIYQPR